MTELLTLPEAAGLLRLPEKTLRHFRLNGVGPKSFKVGRRVMYTREDVETWIQEQRATGTGEPAA